MLAIKQKESGQVSMEFLSYFGFLLLIFALFAPIFLNQLMEIERFGGNLEAERVATNIEREINLAVMFGDGYNRNFSLPPRIFNNDYSVELDAEARVVTIDWAEGIETRQVIGKEFSGNITPGENVIYNIENEIVIM